MNYSQKIVRRYDWYKANRREIVKLTILAALTAITIYLILL